YTLNFILKTSILRLMVVHTLYLSTTSAIFLSIGKHENINFIFFFFFFLLPQAEGFTLTKADLKNSEVNLVVISASCLFMTKPSITLEKYYLSGAGDAVVRRFSQLVSPYAALIPLYVWSENGGQEAEISAKVPGVKC
ncbi:hypothetical protein, partial [Shigella sonnei]|uniref:hypothetical protein n=1 Tax=Shigella sonnei TaxID=624 RepID=UPI001C0A7CEC